MDHLQKIYAMDHFVILTLHEQLVKNVLHVGQWRFYRGFVELSVDHYTTNGPPGPRWESLAN